MVFITHKVLNQLHSDTIACVLYELLVCRSLGFGIVFRDFPSRLRFHKFQYCSIFKVLRCLKQLVYFTSSSPVCQVLFWNFLKQSFQSAAVFRTALLGYHIRFDLSTAFWGFSKFEKFNSQMQQLFAYIFVHFIAPQQSRQHSLFC